MKVFKGENWAISSQPPPTDASGDLRRVDLTAERVDEVTFVAGPSTSQVTTPIVGVQYSQYLGGSTAALAGTSKIEAKRATTTNQAASYDDQSSSGANPAAPLYVDTWFESKGQFCRFQRFDNKIVETEVGEWKAGEVVYEGELQPCLIYTGKTSGVRYYTWILGCISGDPQGGSLRSKGKGKAT